MIWNYVPVTIIFLFAAVIELALAWVSWKQRAINGVLPFAFMNLAGAIWCLGSAFQTSTLDISAAVFWVKLQFWGIVNIPPLWLLFVLAYVGQSRWLLRRYLALLWIIPVISLFLVLTNELHGLMWSRVYQVTSQPTPMIVFDYGPMLWFLAIYGYVLLLVGGAVMIGAIIRHPHLYRHQAFPMLVGVAIPWISSLGYLAGLTRAIDYTPLAITITGLVFIWNILRYRSLNLVPVARDILIENMNDGVLVLDAQNRVVDINPTAQRMFGFESRIVMGQNVDEVLTNWYYPEDFRWDAGDSKMVICKLDQPACFLDLHISNINDRRHHLAGRLIVFRDVTEQKQAEQDEREQHMMAEILQHTVAAINSTLDFEEVLDLILVYVEQVVPHDAASIALLDEQGLIHTKRARGYEAYQQEEFIASLSVPYTFFPNWRAMFESRKPIVIPDTYLYPDWVRMPQTAWVHSYAGAPIILEGKVIGLLNLDSATPGFFNDIHAERLQTFADQAAVAIEKARLFSEANSRAELMSTINRIGLAITSGLDLEHVLKTLYEQVQQAIPTDVFYIALYDTKSQMISFPLWFEQGEYHQIPSRTIETSGLTNYIIQSRKTLYIPDTLAPNFEPPAPLNRQGGNPARSYIGAPFVLGDQVLGAISMQSYQPNAYTIDQVHLLETVASQASITIENARLFAKMEQLATIDSVTDLYNRRHFILLASQEVERTIRYHKKLTALMVDIDHFKRVNDTYGHAAGDQVLWMVANLCKLSLRGVDIIGRYGGDEFAIIFPETEIEEACRAAERLRLLIEQQENIYNQAVIKVTASFGLAEFGDTPVDLEPLLACTDQALYMAKQSGRNNVKALPQPCVQKPVDFPA